MTERRLNATEVAYRLGISCKTLNTWYQFKRENPENEYAKLLPDYEQENIRAKRLWKESDVSLLTYFQKTIPRGQAGVLGSVTQKYIKKDKPVTHKVYKSEDKSIVVGKTKSMSYIEIIEELMKANCVVDITAEYIIEMLNSEYEWRTGNVA